MSPVLIDLSQWTPFGIPLESFYAKALTFVVLMVVAYTLTTALMRRQGRRGRWRDPIVLSCSAGLIVVALGLIWVVTKVHGYGLMMASGFLTAMLVARRRTIRCGEDPEVISTVGILALIGGVVG
ncbi:unnamed protein product, partial [marine sediment metagenome]